MSEDQVIRRYQCIRKCYFNAFLWEVGMVLDSSTPPSKHFKEVTDYLPQGGGMYTERQAIILELGELKARFNNNWPLDRLRTLLKEYKEASLQTKGDILSELAVGIGVPPTEDEALERLEDRLESKRKEDSFTEGVGRKALIRELKNRGVSYSKYQSTEVLRTKLADAVRVEHTLSKETQSKE